MSDGDTLRDAGCKTVLDNNAAFKGMFDMLMIDIFNEQPDHLIDAVYIRSRSWFAPKHPNAWGAAIRSCKLLRACGYRKSGDPRAHSRMVRVYEVIRKEYP